MGDQELGENLEKNSENGMTVSVRRRWTRDDESEWPEAADWIKEQHDRLRAILADPPSEGEGGTVVSDPRPTLAELSSSGVLAAQT